MSEVMADVGFRDMSLPDIGLTEVQVAELNAFVQKKVEKVVEETRGEMRDKIEKLERSIRINKEKARKFQNIMRTIDFWCNSRTHLHFAMQEGFLKS